MGINAAPVFRANAAGPLGTTALRPKKLTVTPGPCSRSQTRATTAFDCSASLIVRTADRPTGTILTPNRLRALSTASFSDPGKRSVTATTGQPRAAASADDI